MNPYRGMKFMVAYSYYLILNMSVELVVTMRYLCHHNPQYSFFVEDLSGGGFSLSSRTCTMFYTLKGCEPRQFLIIGKRFLEKTYLYVCLCKLVQPNLFKYNYSNLYTP